MQETISSKIMFDRRDYQLLALVNGILRKETSVKHARRFFYAHFHPNGIKELAETRGLRIAYAVIQLLESLEGGKVDARLGALRNLRDEVFYTPQGPLRKNTARVLLEIMKKMVRAHGDVPHQLELAHDFRMCTFGKPRMIRRQLQQHHLLELSEQWNQIAFDDHVHDANTKGRKSATHLIMDAWIKGIRRLRVMYYNWVPPRVAAELIEAARIMEIDVRIGIEFSARFYDRYVHLIWVPRGFPDAQAFLIFLEDPPVMAMMLEGRKVSARQQRYVQELLQAFNTTHRQAAATTCGLSIGTLNFNDFVKFVGSGQMSLLHLSQFIHLHLLAAMQLHLKSLREQWQDADETTRKDIEARVTQLNQLDLETLVESYLEPGNNPDIPDPGIPAPGIPAPGIPAPSISDSGISGAAEEIPALLQLTPRQVVRRLMELHAGFRITLNLSNLQVEDVLEILYDTEGVITRLEMFNLKDHADAKTAHLVDIGLLQTAINAQNVVTLKRVIRKTLERLKRAASPNGRQIKAIEVILHDIDSFRAYYSGKILKSRIGSDSTGRTARVHGMGLAIIETLPYRTQIVLRRQERTSARMVLPIQLPVLRQISYIPRTSSNPWLNALLVRLRQVPGLRRAVVTPRESWKVEASKTHSSSAGNIVTLGGVQKEKDNGLFLKKTAAHTGTGRLSWKYLNSNLRNVLKILLGFIPAFATFALTKDWWVLAWGGAVIWFGITGLRNIVQSVMGGGGLRRSPLLRWNDYVQWDRLADSLMFTGFSVPLLDLLVKTLILDHGLGITTLTSPVLLYSVIALANGVYLAGHNLLRGLPRAVVIGNFFRSVFSIPLAIAFNYGIALWLSWAGVATPEIILQQWAAVISKLASDCVAGVIEGLADRRQNMQMRYRDYQTTFAHLFESYAQLEMLYPESDTRDILQTTRPEPATGRAEVQDLEKIITIHALDMLYYWMYQPRSRPCLLHLLRRLSPEERHIILRSQWILQRRRDISLMFVNGILGDDFSRALSFYLDRTPAYLNAIARLESQFEDAFALSR